MQYSPIARNFYRIRRVLVESLGLPRDQVHPATALAALVPRERRKQVWRRFRAEGIAVPPLMPTCAQTALALSASVVSMLFGYFTLLSGWLICGGSVGLLIVALCLLFWWAKDVDDEWTLGDLALSITSAHECREAGYRFTRNEILLKVCIALAESGGMRRSEVTPEKTLTELGFD